MDGNIYKEMWELCTRENIPDHVTARFKQLVEQAYVAGKRYEKRALVTRLGLDEP